MAEQNPYSSPQSELGSPEALGDVKIFAYSGRIGRLRYLAYSGIFVMVLYLVMAFVAGIAAALGDAGGALAGFAIMLLMLAVIPVVFMFIIQRLHDMNASGWLSLLMLVPFVGTVFSLVLLFAPGTQGENRFGLQPKANGAGVIIGAFAPLALLVFMTIVMAAVAIPAYQDYIQRAQSMEQQQGQ